MSTATIAGAAPPWAVPMENLAASDWVVVPPLPDGVTVAPTLIRIAATRGLLAAAECAPGTRLPRFCPELHINSDSSFCLGRRSYQVAREPDVSAFWQDLGEFLVNQHFAARRGRWPTGRWLSHGPDAADMQARAEAIAEAIGFEDDYAECLEMDHGWLADEARREGDEIAPRARCPRQCKDAAGRDLLFASCPHRRALKRIVKAERLRRAAERRFFHALRRGGRKCCGRVARCPLKEGGAR